MKRYLFPLLSVCGLAGVLTLAVWTVQVQQAEAHCQVPCGIYDDAARIAQLREDSLTIAKAIDNVHLLAGKSDAQSMNQATRWIMTKEDHATHIIDVVSEYFLTQKVKPVAAGTEGYDAYLKALSDHHAVMVCAMKTKQNADPKTVADLNAAIDRLAVHYMPKEPPSDMHAHDSHGDKGHSHEISDREQAHRGEIAGGNHAGHDHNGHDHAGHSHD